MPWSATVCIMLPPRGAPNWNQEFVHSWRVGAIVDIFPYKGDLADVSAPRTGYVHVHDIPDTITLESLKAVYLAPNGDLLTTGERRKHWAKPANLPGPARNALLNDRQLTGVLWSQIKNYVVDLDTDQPPADGDFEA